MLPFRGDRWGWTAAVQGDRAASEEGGRTGLVRHMSQDECTHAIGCSTARRARIRIGATISGCWTSSADVRTDGLDWREPRNTACLDWKERLLSGRHLIPELPLFADQAARCAPSSGCGFRIFMASQRSGGCGEWFFPIVEALFGSRNHRPPGDPGTVPARSGEASLMRGFSARWRRPGGESRYGLVDEMRANAFGGHVHSKSGATVDWRSALSRHHGDGLRQGSGRWLGDRAVESLSLAGQQARISRDIQWRMKSNGQAQNGLMNTAQQSLAMSTIW
jgi:hypothetical protein